MGLGQGRPNTVGRGVTALAAVAAVAGIWLTTATAQDVPVQRRGATVPSGTTPINTALVQAYTNNPQLNAQRAATRAVDENVAIALGGYRPRVTATGSLQETYLETLSRTGVTSTCNSGVNCGAVGAARYGVTATQTLFNGFQTGNRTRQAEAQVFSARETLRSTEQTGAAERGDRLHEPAARHRAPRAAAQQRDRARSDAAADARPLQCRRSDAHRRGAGGIPAGRRPLVSC